MNSVLTTDEPQPGLRGAGAISDRRPTTRLVFSPPHGVGSNYPSALYHRVYHRVYHGVSTSGHPPVGVCVFVSCFPATVCGVQGLSSRCSSIPCPSAFPWHSARKLAGHGRSLRSLSRKGKGSAPAPRRTFAAPAARPALRWRGDKPCPPMLVFVVLCAVLSALGCSVLPHHQTDTRLHRRRGGDVRLVSRCGSFCICVTPFFLWRTPQQLRSP